MYAAAQISLLPHRSPKPERFPWLLFILSPSAEASRWPGAAFCPLKCGRRVLGQIHNVLLVPTPVLIPVSSCGGQGPPSQLCQPDVLPQESRCGKPGTGTRVTTDAGLPCSLLQTLYQIRGRLLSEQGGAVVKGQCLLLSYLTW